MGAAYHYNMFQRGGQSVSVKRDANTSLVATSSSHTADHSMWMFTTVSFGPRVAGFSFEYKGVHISPQDMLLVMVDDKVLFGRAAGEFGSGTWRNTGLITTAGIISPGKHTVSIGLVTTASGHSIDIKSLRLYQSSTITATHNLPSMFPSMEIQVSAIDSSSTQIELLLKDPTGNIIGLNHPAKSTDTRPSYYTTKESNGTSSVGLFLKNTVPGLYTLTLIGIKNVPFVVFFGLLNDTSNNQTRSGIITAGAQYQIHFSLNTTNNTMNLTLPEFPLGDLNLDGDVDSDDALLLAPYLNTKVQGGTSDPRDLNHDGIIDAKDMALLKASCTNQNCAPKM